jgi:hypothetical protein
MLNGKKSKRILINLALTVISKQLAQLAVS